MFEHQARGNSLFGHCIAAVVVVVGVSHAVALAQRPADFRGPLGKRPNIVLVITDDQGYGDLGCHGNKIIKTPALDQLYKESIRLTNFHVDPTCSPTRSALLTGRYSCRTGVWHTIMGRSLLRRDEKTCGDLFAEAGYRTAVFGKWHLGDNYPYRAMDRGFHESLVHGGGGIGQTPDYWGNTYFSPVLCHNGKWEKSNGYCTDVFFDAAIKFIEENRNRPFYLHCCPTLLHGGEGSWRKSMDHPLVSGEGQLDAVPRGMTPRAELLKTVERNGFDSNSPTAGEAWIDDALGAIVDKLKALGIDDNTLIVFAPDHGRDGKASLFSRDGTCIPCIARWPSRIPPGLVCDELVQNIDWASTFFEIAGARVPAGYRLDGHSLVPLFDDGTASPWRDHLYFEMGVARAVATKDWKYIAVRYTKEQVEAIKRARPESLPRLMSYIGRLGIGVRGAVHPGFFDADQLYDLRRDPDEMNSLAARPEHADQLNRMRRLLREDLKRMGRPFGEFVPGGNAAPPGLIDEQIAMVKKLKIEGKNVVVPGEHSDDDAPRPPIRRKTRTPRTKRKSL